jgi:hypothetical protein
MIALIAGGFGKATFEAYSPDGGCSLNLPIYARNTLTPTLGFINGKITYCPSTYDNRFNKRAMKTFLLVLTC